MGVYFVHKGSRGDLSVFSCRLNHTAERSERGFHLLSTSGGETTLAGPDVWVGNEALRLHVWSCSVRLTLPPQCSTSVWYFSTGLPQIHFKPSSSRFGHISLTMLHRKVQGGLKIEKRLEKKEIWAIGTFWRKWNWSCIHTFSWDLLPGRRRVHEGSVLDLVIDVLVLVEGEGAAQADVHDDAHWPHVQRAVVAFASEHLRRQVGRRSDHRPPKWLLTNDAGEAKVTEFYLSHKHIDNACVSTNKLKKDRHTQTHAHIHSLPEGRVQQRPAAHSQALGHSGQCSWNVDVSEPPESTQNNNPNPC